MNVIIKASVQISTHFVLLVRNTISMLKQIYYGKAPSINYEIAKSLKKAQSLTGFMNLNRKVTTTGIFSGAAVALVFYLLAMRYHAYLPAPLFFISIGLMLGVITYQCLALRLSSRFTSVVLLEIIATSSIFHFIYQVPTYGLYGSDAYLDLASLKSILISGVIRGVPEYVQLTAYFPLIHILGAELSLVTGIDAFAIAKWFPSLIDVATIPLLYLIIRHIFKQERVALLSVLLFISLQHHILFGSLFVRETIALVLMVCCIYLYIAAESSQHPVAYRVLSMFCLAGTVLAHHLTALMLVLFLSVHWLVTNISKSPALRRSLFNNVTGENINLSFVLIAFIGTLTFWITTIIEPVRILTVFVQNLFTPKVWGTYTYLEQSSLSLPSFRYYVLIYGSYFCYFVFGLLLLRRLLPKGGNRHLETYSFSLYLFICGITGAISFYLVPAIVAGDRFLTFGWLFAFGPLVLAIVENARKSLMALGIFFLVFFMFLNMYTIHPTLWNPQANGSGGAAGEEDFTLARTVNFSSEAILGNLNNLMSIYDVQNTLGVDAFALSVPINVNEFDWVIVNRKGLKEEEELHSKCALAAIADMERLEEEGAPSFNKEYESNNLSVFKRR